MWHLSVLILVVLNISKSRHITTNVNSGSEGCLLILQRIIFKGCLYSFFLFRNISLFPSGKSFKIFFLWVSFIIYNFLNRIGGSGTDLRSKARVIIHLLLKNKNRKPCCCRCHSCLMVIICSNVLLRIKRPSQDLLAILQSFPSGIMMVPVRVKPLVKIVKWSCSKFF